MTLKSLETLEERLTDYKSSFEVTNIGNSAELHRAADKLMQEQRRQVRRLQNKKKVNRAEIKRALTAHSKEMWRLKMKSFVRFSEEIVDTPIALRLRKVLRKEHSNGLGSFI
jgi:hypothetical protein